MIAAFAFLILVLILVGAVATVATADYGRVVLRRFVLDIVELNQRIEQGKIDVDRQRAELDYHEQIAQTKIQEHRQRLLGAPGEVQR